MKKLLFLFSLFAFLFLSQPAFAKTTVAHMPTHHRHTHVTNPKYWIPKEHINKSHESKHSYSLIGQLQTLHDTVKNVYYDNGYYKFDTTTGYTVDVVKIQQTDVATQLLTSWLEGKNVTLNLDTQNSTNQEDWFVSSWFVSP
jgi:hypothetical protein